MFLNDIHFPDQDAGGFGSIGLPSGNLFLYLINDRFITAQSAPITSPRTAEPGPGTWTVTDTANKLSIPGNAALFVANGVWGNPGLSSPNLIGFHTGRMYEIMYRETSAGNEARFGFRTGANAFCDASFGGILSATLTAGGVISTPINQTYTVRQIAGSEYAWWFIKGGIYTTWTLINIAPLNIQSNLYPAFTPFNYAGSVFSIQVYDTDWPALGQYTAYDASATAITGTADGLINVVWLCQTGETLNVAFRQTDANHRLILRCDEAANTVAVIQDNAGETVLGSTASTWTPGTLYYVRVRLSGTSIVSGSLNVTSSFNQTATGINVSGGAKVRDLIQWPVTYTDTFVAQSSYKATRNFWAYGDSKTDGSGDISPFLAYLPFLCRATYGMEVPARKGVGGRSTADAAAAIAADLAAAVGTPDYICYNLGANDIGAFEATWKANTLAIWDAMHAKWPNARIGAAQTWTRTGDNATLRAWRTYCIGQRSSFVVEGPDENIVLEAGDNGVTYTADGVHPNHAGYIRMGAAWKVAFGL